MGDGLPLATYRDRLRQLEFFVGDPPDPATCLG